MPASYTCPSNGVPEPWEFQAVTSDDLFHGVHAVLVGRIPITTPPRGAHPDFPVRAFVRCDSCGRGLTGG
jgi:hypothetical protein